jgi:hypothetical protein
MEYLGAWGTLIHEKNLKSKISCQTPFNLSISLLLPVLPNVMEDGKDMFPSHYPLSSDDSYLGVSIRLHTMYFTWIYDH